MPLFGSCYCTSLAIGQRDSRADGTNYHTRHYQNHYYYFDDHRPSPSRMSLLGYLNPEYIMF
jgi:hypothetical protein